MNYYKHFVYDMELQTYIATQVNDKREDKYKVSNSIEPLLFLEKDIENQTEALIKVNAFYYLRPIFYLTIGLNAQPDNETSELDSEINSIKLFVYDYYIINNIDSENSIEFTDTSQDQGNEDNFQIIANNKAHKLITLKCVNCEKISEINSRNKLLNKKIELYNKQADEKFSNLELTQIRLNKSFITLTFKYYEN